MRAIRALALCWPLLGGCAWITQHNATSAKLEREYEMAQLRAADLEAQVAQATTRIEQLEATVREQGQSQAARLETIDQVNDEIARLRGQIESLQFSVDEMKAALEADRTQRELRMLYTDRRLDALERLMKVKPPPMPTINDLSGTAPVADPTNPPVDCPNPPCTPTTPVTDPPPVESYKTAKEALDGAIEHMKAGRQPVARAILEKAIVDFPGASETAVIRYRIGETYFNESDYKKAAKAFQSVIDNHGSSDWAAWAMFRQGECFENLQQADTAKLFYESAVKTYPRSEAAKEAKKKLAAK